MPVTKGGGEGGVGEVSYPKLPCRLLQLITDAFPELETHHRELLFTLHQREAARERGDSNRTGSYSSCACY